MQCALLAPKQAMQGRQQQWHSDTMISNVSSKVGGTWEEQEHVRWTVPPQVVLCTELHIGADNGNLHSDEHRQRAHHETEPKDVVEVTLRDMNKVLIRPRSVTPDRRACPRPCES